MPGYCCSDEADDEASASEEDIEAITRATREIFCDEADSAAASSELQLKLQVLSEAQKTVSASPRPATDWAKVGAELRSIADTFADDGRGPDDVDGHHNLVQGSDFVSLINLMPVSYTHLTLPTIYSV